MSPNCFKEFITTYYKHLANELFFISSVGFVIKSQITIKHYCIHLIRYLDNIVIIALVPTFEEMGDKQISGVSF